MFVLALDMHWKNMFSLMWVYRFLLLFAFADNFSLNFINSCFQNAYNNKYGITLYLIFCHQLKTFLKKFHTTIRYVRQWIYVSRCPSCMSLTSVCGWATNVVCTNVFYYYYSIYFVFSTYYNWMIDRYAINFEKLHV